MHGFKLPFLTLLVLCSAVNAQELTPYSVTYKTNFQGMKASATRTLTTLDDSQYRFESNVELTILGQPLTRITEISDFLMDDKLYPVHYEFTQSGIGSRSRSADYNRQEGMITTTVDGDSQTRTYNGTVVDDLSQFIAIRRQLQEGQDVITFNGVDEHAIEPLRFRVIANESLDTPLGPLETVKVEKIRDEDSERVTYFWFAPSMEYILVKLFQRDSRGREIDMDITTIEFDDNSVESLN